MTLFRNLYRVASARHSQWDYAAPGWYFVTLCTRNYACVLGKIVRDMMVLSPAGRIVSEEWQRTAEVRPYVVLDAFVVMPNHLHGLIGIDSTTPAARQDDASADTDRSVETPRRGVSTGSSSKTNNRARLHPHSLGAIIGQFKSVCTKRIRRDGYNDFAWQPRFHDHVVRSEQAFQRIRRYILENPTRWQRDCYFSTT